MDNNYIEQDDDQTYMLPNLDMTGLSRVGEYRVMRAFEGNHVNSLINAHRLAEQSRVSSAAVICQSKVEELVTHCLKRHPRPEAVQNITAISRANAMRLIEISMDEDWRR